MNIRQKICVIGSGGHAKVVISTLHAAGYDVASVLDDDSSRWGSDLLGISVAGPVSKLDASPSVQGIIAVGSNEDRRALAQRFRHVKWLTLIHPQAYVHSTARLGPGTVVFAGAVIQPDVSVGAHCIINTSASVDHDCVLEDFAQAAPGSHIGGRVRLSEGAFIGIGGSVIQCVSVGPWTIVGAGGVVTEDLKGGVVAVGVPARPIKERSAWNTRT